MPYHSLGMEYSLFFFLIPPLVYLPHLLLHYYHSEVNHKNTPPLENGMVLFQVIHSSRSGQTHFHPVFSATVCWHKVPSGPGTFHRFWKFLLKSFCFFMWPVGNRFVLHTAQSVKVHRSGYSLKYFDHTC